MRQWTVKIRWSSDEKAVMDAEGTIPIDGTMHPIHYAEAISDTVRMMSSMATARMKRDGVKYNSRLTSVSVESKGRVRRFVISQDRAMSDEEAKKWSEQMLDWIVSDETTELVRD